MKLMALLPGDKVELPGTSRWAIYVGRVIPHPIYPTLALVIWRLDDGTWSHDALDPQQDVGNVTTRSNDKRQANLRWAFFNQKEVAQ